MTLRRLKWAVIFAMIVFLAVLEYSRVVLSGYLLSWPGTLLLYGVVLVCVLFFSAAVFKVFEEMQAQLGRRNQELLALHDAGLDISAELSLNAVLQKVVDTARELVDAKYGALAAYQDDDSIYAFFTSGVDEETHRKVGKPPEGRGLLGIPLKEGERVRLEEVSQHPAFSGLPAHHPPIRSLLAVPIMCTVPCRGNLYLSEKTRGSAFSAEDEETLARFATQAAIAIDNAFLHRQVRELAVLEERQRIAHEMHDGLAQVLAYVNTKAQAVREYLRAGKAKEAQAQLDQLAVAARDVYGDVREAILGLRSTSGRSQPLAEKLREYMELWQHLSGVSAELKVDDGLRVAPDVELQLVRIVQEGLANVRKHAEAKRARVLLREEDGELILKVIDDGVGFNPEMLGRSTHPRFGLATMRERAESVGGSVQVKSAPGEGTELLVTLPGLPSEALTTERLAHANSHR